MNSKTKIFYILIPLILCLSFIGGLLTGGFFSRKEKNGVQDKIRMIMEIIDKEYVDKVSTDSILEASIPDILAKLDPHSSYIPAEAFQSQNEILEGSFGGIGITFNMLIDTVTVMELVPGGIAEKVGIVPGDRIITVNDTLVAGKGLSSEKVSNMMRGPVGSKVKIGVKRGSNPDLLEFDITRSEVPVTSIDAAYLIEPGVGYVRVNKFGKSTFQEFRNSMVDLKLQGANKFIIDLRNNTGGYMQPAILMANEFLGGGLPIVSTRGRTDISNSSYSSDGTGIFQMDELVVLIDEGSASASEIFAGAIQDNDRGLIIGRRSFGKGLVQNQIMLPDESAVRLTIARYYTPSGRSIQKPYTPGSIASYEMEIYDRFNHGEGLSADSVKLDKSHVYKTIGGRNVYGGGGIMPDVYVIGDTTGVTPYYINVWNANMLHRFAFSYTDKNRDILEEAKTPQELLASLPSDDVLLSQFVNYAKTEGNIVPRWGWITDSRELLLNQLKTLIAGDVLGQSAAYEVQNLTDEVVNEALDAINSGETRYPIRISIEN